MGRIAGQVAKNQTLLARPRATDNGEDRAPQPLVQSGEVGSRIGEGRALVRDHNAHTAFRSLRVQVIRGGERQDGLADVLDGETPIILTRVADDDDLALSEAICNPVAAASRDRIQA